MSARTHGKTSQLAGFLERFVRPFIAGGEALVGPPLSVARVAELAARLGDVPDALAAVDDARAGAIAPLVVCPPSLAFDEEDLRLAAGLYDALVLLHPDLGWAVAGRGARARVRDAARALLDVGPPDGRARLLGRHALVQGLLEIEREDVVVRWWAGSAEFRGRPPPARLFVLSSIRRVREERRVSRLADLVGAEDGVPIELVELALRASPLTRLFRPARPGAPFAWTDDVVALLSDPELARTALYAWLGPRPTADSLAAHPAAAAAAFGRLIGLGEARPTEARPEVVRVVLSALVHLSALLALAEAKAGAREEPSALISAALARSTDGIALVLALPSAAARVAPALAAPPGLVEDPALARRWAIHRRQVEGALGDELLSAVSARLRAVLRSG